jgi:hypothetical protein
MEEIRVVGRIVLICLLSTMNTTAAQRSKEDCHVFTDYEVSPHEYLRLDVYCNPSTPFEPENVEKVFISLHPPCSESLQTDALFTNSTALTHVYLRDYNNIIQYLDDTSFHTLINIRELSLVGFARLLRVTGGVFQPLRSIERLFLKGFGFNYMKYKDIGLALAGLSGTPLQVIAMDGIHGVLSPGKMLDLNELFQIRNVSIKTWVFSNNLVTEYVGMVSDILPDLQYFCMGITGPIDFVSYNELTLDMLIRSKNLTEFILYPLAIDLIDNSITGD